MLLKLNYSKIFNRVILTLRFYLAYLWNLNHDILSLSLSVIHVIVVTMSNFNCITIHGFLYFEKQWTHNPLPSIVHEFISNILWQFEGDELFYQKKSQQCFDPSIVHEFISNILWQFEGDQLFYQKKSQQCFDLTFFSTKEFIDLNNPWLIEIIVKWKRYGYLTYNPIGYSIATKNDWFVWRWLSANIFHE